MVKISVKSKVAVILSVLALVLCFAFQNCSSQISSQAGLPTSTTPGESNQQDPALITDPVVTIPNDDLNDQQGAQKIN